MNKIFREIIRPFKQLKSSLLIIYYRKRHECCKEEFFKGKRVAIVGGADSVLNEKNGSYIDSFDIVVRINNGVDLTQTQSQFVGNRTDILFHSFCSPVGANKKFTSELNIDLWENNLIKKLVFSHSLKSNFGKDFLSITRINTSIKYFYTDENLYQSMLELLNGAIPTAGFVAIKTIIDSEPKELFITGFTFFKTPFNVEYRNWDKEDYSTHQANTHHNFNLEFNYLKNIYLNKNLNGYIKVDKPLERLFKS